MKFNVIRAHIGDRDYAVGDVREADPRSVAHLVGLCLVAADEAPEPDADEAPEPAKKKPRAAAKVEDEAV